MRRALILSCAALAACAAPPPQPPEANLALPPAERETDYLTRALLAMHPDPFGRCSVAGFREAAAEAAARMREDDADGWHLELRRLVALVGDAHTRVEGLGPFERSAAPVLLRGFADGWWIFGAFDGHMDLVGARVLQVEGRPMEEVLDALRPYASYENEESLRQAAPAFLRRPAFLHAIRLAAKPDELRLLVRGWDRFEREVTLPAVAEDGVYGVRRIRPVTRDPWAERHPERNYWHAFPAEGVLYLRYRACRPDPAQSPADFAADVEAALRAHPRRVIIDLRGNGGGDSRVFAPVIALFERGGPGRGLQLYALTDAGTFSSGLLNAWQLRERAGAILAGEPSAQRPNCHGEILPIVLPVSGTHLMCSTKSFHLVPGDPEVLAVDLPVPENGADWFRGRDPLLAQLLAE